MNVLLIHRKPFPFIFHLQRSRMESGKIPLCEQIYLHKVTWIPIWIIYSNLSSCEFLYLDLIPKGQLQVRWISDILYLILDLFSENWMWVITLNFDFYHVGYINCGVYRSCFSEILWGYPGPIVPLLICSWADILIF